jgi:type I restriction enzyme S subunit
VKSEVFIRYIFFDCYGGGQDNISMGDILNMVFPYPPLSEQEEIVSYLDEQTQLIDKTISVEQRRIKLLKEYRQSLISEVVTGKRKVTNDE